MPQSGMQKKPCIAVKETATGVHRQPIRSAGMWIIPQRETVAGDAAARSEASKIKRRVCALSRIRSPFGKHSAQLSSST